MVRVSKLVALKEQGRVLLRLRGTAVQGWMAARDARMPTKDVGHLFILRAATCYPIVAYPIVAATTPTILLIL